MIRLAGSVKAWGTADFIAVLKGEIEALDAGQLPLQQALATSSYAMDDKLSVMIVSVAEEEGTILAKAGIFYTGIIAGCSCADDPTPLGENIEYCEVQFAIDKQTADAKVTLLRQ